jgi:hypothetical protein
MIELSEETRARLRAFEKIPRADRWKQPMHVRAALIGELARHDYSASDMGDIFGCSRNAVIGFADRQNVQLGGHVKHSMRSTKRADRPARIVRPKIGPVAPKAERAKPVKAPKPEPIVDNPNAVLTFAPRPAPVHILDADYRHCRFPLWNDERKPTVAEMFFCGRAKEDILKPYCAECSGSGLTYLAPERRRAA